MLIECGDYLGGLLAERAMKMVGFTVDAVEGIGIGALLERGGVVKHRAAVLHIRTQERGFGKLFATRLMVV